MASWEFIPSNNLYKAQLELYTWNKVTHSCLEAGYMLCMLWTHLITMNHWANMYTKVLIPAAVALLVCGHKHTVSSMSGGEVVFPLLHLLESPNSLTCQFTTSKCGCAINKQRCSGMQTRLHRGLLGCNCPLRFHHMSCFCGD